MTRHFSLGAFYGGLTAFLLLMATFMAIHSGNILALSFFPAVLLGGIMIGLLIAVFVEEGAE